MPARTARPNFRRSATTRRTHRRGAVLVFSAMLIVVVCAMAAMAIDVGFMMLVKTQLQVAADAGALAAGNALHQTRPEVIAVAEDFCTQHNAGGRNIKQSEVGVEIGIWDAATGTFSAQPGVGNAVRVTCRRQDESLFFGRVIGSQTFSTEASAIAMANPKDIAFVVDLSGSMNDDTEPAWATTTVNNEFGPLGFPGIGNQLMQDVYQDFGFGGFPGTLEYLGAPLGVAQADIAYAEMTSDIGPLSGASIPAQYRITAGDDEETRRVKAYSWIIENQLRRLMPQARPSADLPNYGYWEKYIDYVLLASYVSSPEPPPPPAPPTSGGASGSGGSTGGSSGGGSTSGGGGDSWTPPPAPKPPIGSTPIRQWIERLAASRAGAVAMLGARRLGLNPTGSILLAGTVYGPAADGPGLPRVGGLNGGYKAWVPPSQDGDRIDQFNNPNKSSFPSADSGLPEALRNYFGYLTYVQYLMDHGRDLRPDGSTPVELSTDSMFCPMHNETVAGRSFRFPPRCQPMHAVRRSVISAMDVVDERNSQIPSLEHRDRVAIITFDTTAGTQVREPLSADYLPAMSTVATLQSVGDKGTTTAAESGLVLARTMLRRQSEGGQAREQSTRIVVLLTDGIPNAYESSEGDINAFVASGDTADSYGGGYYWLDAPIMQSHALEAEGVDVYPVGVGLGTDYNFMDRAARVGGTGGDNGQSRRGSGNPAEYEVVLTQIFEEIISRPTARLVE